MVACHTGHLSNTVHVNFQASQLASASLGVASQREAGYPCMTDPISPSPARSATGSSTPSPTAALECAMQLWAASPAPTLGSVWTCLSPMRMWILSLWTSPLMTGPVGTWASPHSLTHQTGQASPPTCHVVTFLVSTSEDFLCSASLARCLPITQVCDALDLLLVGAVPGQRTQCCCCVAFRLVASSRGITLLANKGVPVCSTPKRSDRLSPTPFVYAGVPMKSCSESCWHSSRIQQS